MKKYGIVLVALAAILVLGYFVMWFFLCQTHAMKVSRLVNKEMDYFLAGNTAQALSEQRAVLQKFRGQYSRHQASRYYQQLNGILNKYDYILSSVTNADSSVSRLTLLNYWAELVRAAEDRGEYSSGSVPLGAIKPLLVKYCTAYEKISGDLAGYTNAFLTSPLVISYRDFQYLLKGKATVLAGYLSSSDTNLQALALDEVLADNMKPMSKNVVAFFRTSPSSSLKKKSVRTLAGMKEFKEGDISEFIRQQLSAPGEEPDSEFIYMLGNSKRRDFLQPVSLLTNSTNGSVRDAALDACNRLRKLP